MKTLEERLARHEVDPNGCWLWLGYIDPLGYGRITFQRRTRRVHLWSYEHHVGPVPPGLELDHLCKVRRCLNPEHLEPVTRRENMARSSVWRHNREKTHCPAGHRYDEANTYVAAGRRQCRICKNARKRAARARAKG